MEASQWIALAAFALNALVTVAAMTWQLSRVELRLSEKITDERQEIDEHLERQAREFGEVAAALRQKVHEIEVWARDTFVRREGFYQVRDDLKNDIKDMGAQINTRIDQLVHTMKNGGSK